MPQNTIDASRRLNLRLGYSSMVEQKPSTHKTLDSISSTWKRNYKNRTIVWSIHQSLLGINTKEKKSYQRDTCTPMHVVKLFTRDWSRWSSMDQKDKCQHLWKLKKKGKKKNQNALERKVEKGSQHWRLGRGRGEVGEGTAVVVHSTAG